MKHIIFLLFIFTSLNCFSQAFVINNTNGTFVVYGLSTDTKPAALARCYFVETNTGKTFKGVAGVWELVGIGVDSVAAALAITTAQIASDLADSTELYREALADSTLAIAVRVQVKTDSVATALADYTDSIALALATKTDSIAVALALRTDSVATVLAANTAAGLATKQDKGISASATLDFPSTGKHSTSDLTMIVVGALLGRPVVLGIPILSVLADSDYTAWVSAIGIVTIRFNNTSQNNGRNPAAGVFTVLIF